MSDASGRWLTVRVGVRLAAGALWHGALRLGAAAALASAVGLVPGAVAGSSAATVILAEPAPASAELTAGVVTIRSAVAPATATIGDLVDLTVVVATPAGYAVSTPALAATVEPFEARSGFDLVEEVQTEDGVVITFRARLAPFSLGPLPLPTVRLLVTGPDGEHDLEAPTVGLLVGSVLPPGDGGPPRLRGLKGLLGLPAGRLARLWPLLVGLGLLAVGRQLWRRRRLLLPAARVAAVKSPAERALEDLRELGVGPLNAQASVKEYHVRLVEILRTFVGDFHGFDAAELTSSELSARLAGPGFDPANRARLTTVMDLCDLAKFACHAPTADERKRSLAVAVELVRATSAAAAATRRQATEPVGLRAQVNR